MKILVFLILLLWTSNALLVSCWGQDCELKLRYENMLSTYNDSMLFVANMYQHDMSMRGNNAALIIESIDTLNKDEIVLTKFVEGTVLESERKWMGISGGQISGDTLKVFIGYIMAKEQIEHFIVNGKTRTFYTEWYKYDNFLKLRKEDTPTNRLKIEVRDHEFEICQEGNIYYGYSKMTIEPYFRQDKYNYKQFLQIHRNSAKCSTKKIELRIIFIFSIRPRKHGKTSTSAKLTLACEKHLMFEFDFGRSIINYKLFEIT